MWKVLFCPSDTGSVTPAPVGYGERDGLCHEVVFVFPLCPIPELVRQRNVKAGMLANASGETHTDRVVGLPAGIISTFMR